MAEVDFKTRDFLERLGVACKEQGLTWEETSALFDELLDAGNEAQAEGCDCKMMLAIFLEGDHPRMVFGHYPGCGHPSQRAK